jgi:hypothetical protein
MATRNVQPKADQPRVTTTGLENRANIPSLQYRASGMQQPRSQSNRSYSSRLTRG